MSSNNPTAVPVEKTSSISASPNRALNPVDDLFNHLRQLYACKPLSKRYTFALTRVQYSELERRINAERDLWGWYEDKFRYDYGDGIYYLRMPITTLHQQFIACIQQHITKAISDLAEQLATNGEEAAAHALKGFCAIRGPYIELLDLDEDEQGATQGSTHPRSPDLTFFPPKTYGYPTLAAEVSYKRQRKDLPGLADDYIVGSALNIQCVLGFDLPYAGANKPGSEARDKTATISVWRAIREEEEDGRKVGRSDCQTDQVPFRDASGEPCDGRLEIFITDLLQPSVINTVINTLSSDIATSAHITITFAELTAFLADAELFVNTGSAQRAKLALAANIIVRKRPRTPPSLS